MPADRLSTPENDLKNPNLRAFLDTIAQAEGANYDTLYGGETFNDHARFPGHGKHTAAGRYQIEAGTYHDLSVALVLTDFSPYTQDLMAVQLLIDKGAMKPLLVGNIDAALSGASVPWVSLPVGPGLPNRRHDQP